MLNGIILVDGGYFRASWKSTSAPIGRRGKRLPYVPNVSYLQELISSIQQTIAEHLSMETKSIRWIRTNYYDTDPFLETLRQPNGMLIDFGSNTSAQRQVQLIRDLECADLISVRKGAIKFRAWETTSTGYKPIFQQKGVDMKIGLKLARREGVVVCLCSLTEQPLTIDLVKHADVVVRV
jgi:hypothetical protein